MSRFQINKFMMYVDGETAHLEDFCSDRAGFVERWIAAAAASQSPVANGGQLDTAEQAALIGNDVGTLYEMGGHPYILLHFARAIDVDFHGIAFPEFDRAYKEAVTPHGYPDFST